MLNVTQASSHQSCLIKDASGSTIIHQGDCVNLDQDKNTYQVIGVDRDHDRCWVRRWPIEPQGGSPVFEISLQRIRALD
ncbi:hypothetical protein [Synechococcus sp. M16CYN]|uniref:hypothetical protein n=1 Tax=Synechococcus sp. M16CYN TaxID=3103139 RepID=UPI003249F9A1